VADDGDTETFGDGHRLVAARVVDEDYLIDDTRRYGRERVLESGGAVACGHDGDDARASLRV
jgi:hypothetical protein